MSSSLQNGKERRGDPTSTPGSVTLSARAHHVVYQGREACAINKIEALPGAGLGVKLTFTSPIATFIHFLCAAGDGRFRRLRSHALEVRFSESDRIQEQTFTVKPVFRDRRLCATYAVKIRCVSTRFYAAQMLSGHPHIIAIDSEPRLHVGAGSIEDWVYRQPTASDRAFAARQWGKLVKPATTAYERARLLAKTLMHDLWPHNGIPSDTMSVAPFEQYRRMISGKDKGYCANFSLIFVCACNALGIPTRSVGLSEIYLHADHAARYGGTGLIVQGGSQHWVTEIFDEGLNQWIWMDLRYHALGARIGNVGPLTLAELHYFINTDARRKQLRLLIYDMASKTERWLPLDRCPRQEFDCFLGWDRGLTYIARPGTPSAKCLRPPA